MPEINGKGELVAQASQPNHRPPLFEDELCFLIQRYISHFATNTPAYILASVMVDAANSFESALLRRSAYFRTPTGIEDYPHDDSGSGFPG
jgi:hypothetical protein